MRNYDTILKEVIQELTEPAFRLVTQAEERVVRWNNVELQGAQTPRVDLLGETVTGGLIHIELQSTNETGMAYRMLEYALAIRRGYGQLPDQVLTYVGREPMRMPNRIQAADLIYGYRLVDLSRVDGEPLIESPALKDNVIAILMRLGDPRTAVRRILRRIAASDRRTQERATEDLGMLSGLRKLGEIIHEEIAAMPILEDIMDHDLLGPKIREGIAIGRQEGRQEGRLNVLQRLLERRFGPLSEAAVKRLESLSSDELEAAALRVLDAANIEEVLR
jgi:predicted transposase YdaD